MLPLLSAGHGRSRCPLGTAVLAAVLLAGCTPDPAFTPEPQLPSGQLSDPILEESVGRYAIAVAGDRVVRIDTKSGQTWVLNSGSITWVDLPDQPKRVAGQPTLDEIAAKVKAVPNGPCEERRVLTEAEALEYLRASKPEDPLRLFDAERTPAKK